MGPKGSRQRSGHAGNFFANEHGNIKAHPHTSEFFRDREAQETQVSGFVQEILHQCVIALFKAMQMRLHFGLHEIGCGLKHHALLFAKIFANEHFIGTGMVNQKMATTT